MITVGRKGETIRLVEQSATALGQKFADDEPTEISVTVSAACVPRMGYR